MSTFDELYACGGEIPEPETPKTVCAVPTAALAKVFSPAASIHDGGIVRSAPPVALTAALSHLACDEEAEAPPPGDRTGCLPDDDGAFDDDYVEGDDLAATGGAPRKFRGVWLDRKRGKYKTRIWISGRTLFLGSHYDETEAARAYDKVAISRSGAGAATNFPVSNYDVAMLTATPLSDLVAELRNSATRTRAATQSSRHRGVSRHKATGKFSARIQDKGQKVRTKVFQRFLGMFSTEEAAVEAFEKEAATLYSSGSPSAHALRAPRPPPTPETRVTSSERVSALLDKKALEAAYALFAMSA